MYAHRLTIDVCTKTKTGWVEKKNDDILQIKKFNAVLFQQIQFPVQA